jgi:hypothetical protein
MKKLAAIGAATLLTSTAHALDTIQDLVDFGDVPLGMSSEVKSVEVVNDTIFLVSDLVIGLSGNDSEYSLSHDCPQAPDDYLYGGDSCIITLVLTPQHHGTKKKKLTIDGVEDPTGTTPREVSITVPIMGTSDNPNKP